jgi:glycosyltransferase involved in cell wall biosynthesis
MRIGIDARLIQETGVGRYIRNLLWELSEIDRRNEYVIYLTPSEYKIYKLPNERWQKRIITVRWHSAAEQIVLPFLYIKDHLDLLHVPYFTVPILYPGKTIVTVHDLIILTNPTGLASTKPLPLYAIKYLGYRIILFLSLLKAKSIITVSHSVKDELLKHFPFVKDKSVVTYEGFDTSICVKENGKPLVKDPYLLVVGNVYPHKNVDILLKALQKAVIDTDFKGKLVFVTKDNPFTTRLKKSVEQKNLRSFVVFLNDVSDSELSALYTHANALLFPSLKEGFGLPALEAIAHNCPVVLSDIPVFKELFGKLNVTFIPPTDVSSWSNMIINASSTNKPKIKYFATEKEKEDFFALFSWRLLAEKTVKQYERCFSV